MFIFIIDFLKCWVFILALNIVSIIPIVASNLYKRKFFSHEADMVTGKENNRRITPLAVGVIAFLICIVCVGLLFFDIDGFIVNAINGNWSFGEDFVLPVFLMTLLILVQAVTLVPYFIINRHRKITEHAAMDSEDENDIKKRSARNYSVMVLLIDFVIISFLIIEIGDYLGVA